MKKKNLKKNHCYFTMNIYKKNGNNFKINFNKLKKIYNKLNGIKCIKKLKNSQKIMKKNHHENHNINMKRLYLFG